MAVTQPKVILVEPSHPGNIGAVARAMKTMSLSQLVLVAPKQFPHPEAVARASRADDILANAIVCDSLAHALEGSHWVVGISARSRKISSEIYAPRQLMQEIKAHFGQLQVAWVFGRERNGLDNEELELCHAMCTIPADPDYSSLNLAAAVQIMAYEWLTSFHSASNERADQSFGAMASAEEIEGFYKHLWHSIAASNFIDPVNPKPLMRKIRRIFDRTRLSRAEVNILRGILKSLEKQ